MHSQIIILRAWHCVNSVQIRSYFWSIFSCIRTRNSSVFGHFSRSVDEKEFHLLQLLAKSSCQLLILVEISKKRKKRNIWVKEWLKKRNRLGAYNIISEFQLQGRYSYRKHLKTLMQLAWRKLL